MLFRSTESNGVEEGTGRIEQVKAPVYILHGEKDTVVPVETAQETLNWLEKGSLVVVPQGGHTLWQDHFEEVVTHLNDFLLNNTYPQLMKA